MKTWIKVERARHDMTQSDLADAVLVSRGTITSIEAGRFAPSVILALRIAEYFKVTVDELFILEDADRPTKAKRRSRKI